MVKNALYILKSEKVLSQFKLNAKQEARKFDIHQIVPFYEDVYNKAMINCISI